MASYVVMEQPGRQGAADVAFLRDGFSWTAFLFPPLWLLWRRLWMEALLVLLAFGLFAALGDFGWPLAGSLLTLAVSFYCGLEGPNLHVGALRRCGWREWGALEAKSLADAEIRYAESASMDEKPAMPDASYLVPRAAAPMRPAHPGLVLGLGHLPGRT